MGLRGVVLEPAFKIKVASRGVETLIFSTLQLFSVEPGVEFRELKGLLVIVLKQKMRFSQPF